MKAFADAIIELHKSVEELEIEIGVDNKIKKEGAIALA